MSVHRWEYVAPAAGRGLGSEPLETVEREFRRIGRERVVEVEVGDLGRHLPQHLLDVIELRALVLHPSTSPRDRGLIWERLTGLALEDGAVAETWRLVVCGMVMPGLRRAAGRLCPLLREHNLDLQQAMLTGLWEALTGLRHKPVARPVAIPSRLVWAADRAARAYRDEVLAHEARRGAALERAASVRQPIHPDALLALAVRRGVLDAAQAELIGRTRLEGCRLERWPNSGGVAAGGGPAP
ncbi:hypothetical protein ACFQZC_08455 [Streptacidiphilus monticola]